jgi:membrane fusion protein (multidrug efflux system)
MPPRSRHRALHLAAAALLAGCQPQSAPAGGGTPATPAPPPLVRAAAVERRPVRRTIQTTSYLESEHRVVVQSKIAGRVDAVLVDEGATVQKGDLLARLDPREAASSLRQAEIQLEDRRVRLELAKLEAQAGAQRVDQARIERDKALSQHQRNLEIDPGLISEKELEDGRYTYESAEEALKVAGVQRQKAELEVLAAQNAIDELEARVGAERIRLAEHEIRAPLDGIVADRMIRGGETINAATDLFVVIDQVHLVSYLRRPQRELATIRSAKEVTFTTDAVPDHSFRAAIDFVSPVIDEATGSFRIRIRVLADDDLAEVLRPGMFVSATILAEEERDALMVPKAALLNEGAQTVVFAIRDGIARRVVLLQGIEERDFVECLNQGQDGLRPGDLLVVSGQQGLVDNTEVEIAEAAATAAAVPATEDGR